MEEKTNEQVNPEEKGQIQQQATAQAEQSESFLAPQNDYLEVGIHIATKVKSAGMKRFIYKVREDGLYLLDLKTIDTKIAVAAAMIAKQSPKDVVITASRIYAIIAAEKCAEIIGANFIKGRVTPGIFTNPYRSDYIEAKLVMISDSRNEKQAIKEASTQNIPIIALSDTDNSTKFIDLIVPANNRGRKSLAFIYFLIAREVLKARGEIKSNEEFKYTPQDFEAKSEGKTSPKHETIQQTAQAGA
jgi:small subunit ribosomal protein S2